MYTVSDAFRRQSRTIRAIITGPVLDYERDDLRVRQQDILKGSGYITNRCSGDNEIELGSVYSAELGITLHRTLTDTRLWCGAEVAFHLELEDGTFETVPMGIFEVAEANQRTAFGAQSLRLYASL